MCNCINSLKEKVIIGDKYIYILYLENKPYIVFSINKKGKLLEAKHKANALLNPNTEFSLKELVSDSLLVHNT